MTHTLSIALLLVAAAPGPDPGSFQSTYLHSLSTSFGPLPFSAAGLSYDPEHRELYVHGDGPVRVFNESGMEVFAFGDSAEFGVVLGIGALDDGNLLALAYRRGGIALVRCTFRGEFLEEIVPRNVPALGPFNPSVMRFAGGKIYLADMAQMTVRVLDAGGAYLTSYDLAERIGEAESRAQLGVRGFAVDPAGNLLFTIQPRFSAYVMTPAGEVERFGKKGSAPGKFNVVGGITRDGAGNTYVADVLKSAILVFDPELNFVKEFGYRGSHPGNLAAPEEIVAAGDKLYVSNRGRRGVSVFRVGAKSPAGEPAVGRSDLSR